MLGSEAKTLPTIWPRFGGWAWGRSSLFSGLILTLVILGGRSAYGQAPTEQPATPPTKINPPPAATPKGGQPPRKKKPKLNRATTRRPVIDTNGQGAERLRVSRRADSARMGKASGTGPTVGAGVDAPLRRHMARLGGAAWLETGLSRPGRVGAPRQGYLRTELWPRGQYFVTHRWAIGLEGGLRLSQFEDQAGALPASGNLPAVPAGRVRVSDRGAGVVGVLSFYQTVVPRLYVQGRVGAGGGAERVIVDFLPNALSTTPGPVPEPPGSARLRHGLRYDQGQIGAGFLYLPNPSLGIEGMITYRVRHYRIREADLGALGRRIYLPEGELTEQGVVIQIGIDWFFDMRRTWQARRERRARPESYGPLQ